MANTNAAGAVSAMTCAEQKDLGPDASIWEIVALVFHYVGVWILGATLLLCCLAPMIARWWHHRVVHDVKNRYYFGGEHDGWKVQDPSVDYGHPLDDPRGWAEEQMKNGKTLDDLPVPEPARTGQECVEFIQKMVAVPLGIILLPVTCALLLPFAIVIAFPLLAKLKAFHLERAIMFCMPLPRGEYDVSLSTYVLPIYACKTLYDCYGFLTKRWKSPDDIAIGPVLVLQEWLALQVFDVYTDGSSLTSMVGHVPLWYFGFWALTSLASVSVVVVAVVWHLQGSMSDSRFFNLLMIQLVAEDIPQFMMSLLTLMLTSLDVNVNQYMIYNLVGNALSCATLAKKLVLTGDRDTTYVFETLPHHE